jgi:uncharacterized membrane protein
MKIHTKADSVLSVETVADSDLKLIAHSSSQPCSKPFVVRSPYLPNMILSISFLVIGICFFNLSNCFSSLSNCCNLISRGVFLNTCKRFATSFLLLLTILEVSPFKIFVLWLHDLPCLPALQLHKAAKFLLSK